MLVIVFIAAGFAGLLLLLLARFSPPLAAQDEQLPPIPLKSLREVTVELLGALEVRVDETLSDDRYLVGARRDPVGEARTVVQLVPAPPGGVVDQQTVLSLAEDVKGQRASVGMLVTPGEIETAGLGGLEVKLELLDGRHFRELVGRLVPARLAMLDRYRGFGHQLQ